MWYVSFHAPSLWSAVSHAHLGYWNWLIPFVNFMGFTISLYLVMGIPRSSLPLHPKLPHYHSLMGRLQCLVGVILPGQLLPNLQADSTRIFYAPNCKICWSSIHCSHCLQYPHDLSNDGIHWIDNCSHADCRKKHWTILVSMEMVNCYCNSSPCDYRCHCLHSTCILSSQKQEQYHLPQVGDHIITKRLDLIISLTIKHTCYCGQINSVGYW